MRQGLSLFNFNFFSNYKPTQALVLTTFRTRFSYHYINRPSSIPSPGPSSLPTIACGDFFDISSDGNVVELQLDDYEQVFMNGTFTFFGHNYSDVFVSSKGFLSFGNNSFGNGTFDCPDCDDYTPDKFPNTNTPNNMIAPLWSDIDPTGGGNITYKYVMSMPDKFVAQWTDIPEYVNSGDINGTNTFQAALFFVSGCIEFRYGPTELEVSSSAGVENIEGTIGLNVPTSGILDGTTACVRLCYDGFNYIPEGPSFAPTISPTNSPPSASTPSASTEFLF